MKLKHVFFSSLLLSVGFTACTNEDFTEISAPVNTSEAIALGENFTIKVSKGVTTRSAFNEEEGAYISYWEEGDKLGAAWVHKVTKVDEDDNTVVVDASAIGGKGNYSGFYSNSPLTLKEGAGTNDGTFATVDDANLFAGAYVLYSPYDKTVSMQGDAIPVSIKSYEFDAANPLKNISENIFSYCPVKFVPGGNQTSDFSLGQVPVLFRLSFTAGEKLNMDLSDGGITIKNIVIQATNSKGNVLVAEGQIVTDSEPTVADYNAPAEDDALADIVKYQNVGNVDHLFITAKGTDNDDYKMLVKDEPTKKEFVFTVLPFSDKADEVTIKVVTDKGTYAKTYTSKDANAITEFEKAAEEGGVVRGNVVLDVTDPDDVIYTAEEFASKWNEAVAAGKHVDLEVGTDLVLEEGLACDNVSADITVTGHKLTVPSLNIAKNRGIDFQNAVVVEGDVFTSGASEFTAGDLTAENVEIQGYAKISANKIAKLTVASSGIVELAAIKSATEPAEIGEIDIQVGTTTSKGKLIYNPINVEVEKMTNAGEVTLTEAMTNPAGKTMTVAKGGTLNIGENDFTNEGTMDVNGTISGTGTFKNVPGAVLNINSNNSFKLVNNADADKEDYKGLAAAVVNIAADVTVTADGTNTIENKGIINVAGKLTEAANGALTQTDDNARIIATTTTAKITMENTAKLAHGYVVILANGNIVNGTDEPVAFNLTSTTTKVPANATTVLVNCDITSAWLNTNSDKNLVIYDSNIEFANNADITLTGSFTVAGDVTVSLASKATNAKLTLSGSKTNGINKGASLTLCEDFEFYYGTNWNPAGSFNPNGATAKAAKA